MCGIVGIWDYKNKIRKEILERMRDTLVHRGSDDQGIFIDEKNNIGFGHQRLSIIDLSEAGHQPMIDEDLVIVFNGEIYNFKEIRKELENKRYKFKSNSDTEVILKSYQEWGKGAIAKFRGMFSFAILNKENGKLILCRDRAGVKPLYYYFDGSLFIFASEIKAIISHPKVEKELNFDGLALFLQFGYIPEPHSIFKNIYKLEPGHFLEIDEKRNIKKEKYWDVIDFYLKGVQKINEQEAVDELENILIDSFKLRLVSDVPVGIFLSGGVDSSLVAALLAKNTNYPLKTFTIGFQEQEYNESERAKKIAGYLGIEHYEILCTEKEAIDIIPKLPEIYDEPFGDSSAIPTYLLSKFVKNYVKVSLSADAGDEIFCGYGHYKLINDIFRGINAVPAIFLNPVFLSQGAKLGNLFLKRPNLQNRIRKMNKAIENKKNLEQVFTTINSHWLKDEISELLIKNFSFSKTFFDDFNRIKNLDLITQMQAVDFKTYLPSDFLTKIDRATMAVGLEGRDPLLDQNIIEYAARLPLKFKYPNKYILKKILNKYLPKELFERPKKGFAAPMDIWFKGRLKPLLEEYLNPQRISRDNIFNSQIISKELVSFEKGSASINRLWLILIFQIWKEKWL